MITSFDVITIFPDIFKSYLAESIVKRAIHKGLLEVKIHNLRDFSHDKHKTVDDYPYGGGPGMVMKIEPIYNAISNIESDGIGRYKILLSPQGTLFNQRKAESLIQKKQRLLLICGRYEGVDERVANLLIDEEISIGDYILTGGELPALILIDCLTRLIPGVLGDEQSARQDSFTCGIFDYPHYTRPAEFKGLRVPEVLLSGNHEEIRRWRIKEALKKTLIKRPDLIDREKLSFEELAILKELENSEEVKKWI